MKKNFDKLGVCDLDDKIKVTVGKLPGLPELEFEIETPMDLWDLIFQLIKVHHKYLKGG